MIFLILYDLLIFINLYNKFSLNYKLTDREFRNLCIVKNQCFFRGEPECIETVLFPSTGEDSQSQYVCVTLIVQLPVGYPDISPTISLRNPRGLDENTVRLMQSDAEAKCKDFIGQPVMFELIEVCITY